MQCLVKDKKKRTHEKAFKGKRLKVAGRGRGRRR